MPQKVTMEDVARQSGVSLATVSLVIRGRPGINDETRQRVLEAARALGYQKRSPADSQASRPAQSLGVLIKGRADDVPLANPFYAPLLAGIEAACRKARLNLLFATIPVNLDNHPTEVPRLLEEGDVDGVMLVGAFVDATITRLIERRALPLVLVDAYTEACYDIVGTDNYRGAYEAVTYLLERGHRHIGLVGTQPDAYPSLKERRRGYIQALEDYGIAERYFGDCRIAKDEELVAATRLLSEQPDISAIFCSNDHVAVRVYEAAQMLGRRIPDDLSIIGFDNVDLALYLSPPLTTMHIDTPGLGTLAVDALVRRIESAEASCMTTLIRPRLIERQSVRALSLLPAPMQD
ncbi:MAG: LacI family DNA-binding transcriptional regulator [Anaerolineae bacterium]